MDQITGEELPGWKQPPRPQKVCLEGRYVMLEPLSAAHASGLFVENSKDKDGAGWTYLPYGPFRDEADYGDWIASVTGKNDPVFLAIKSKDASCYCGVASYLRIMPEAGSIEVGHIRMAPALQRSRASTEAMFLMMQWAFEAGYRRYEWKCDALNQPSRRAAERLGLSYEGVFRQATIVKGRNRDTAWFAAIDKEWPALKAAFEQWLLPTNFNTNKQQIASLADLTRLIRVTSDPTLR